MTEPRDGMPDAFVSKDVHETAYGESGPVAADRWGAASADLQESCPELRPSLYLPDGTARWFEAANRSRIEKDDLRSYEWWQLDALDRSGNALSISLFHGNPFDPAYRRSLQNEGQDEEVNRRRLMPASFPAVRMSLIVSGSLAARGYRSAHDMPFSERHAGTAGWSAGFDDLRLHHEPSTGGWRIAGSIPLDPIGLWNDLGLSWCHDRSAETSMPTPTAAIDVTITPAFAGPTVQRASMPDSPAGDRHDWFLMCPAGIVNGLVSIEPMSTVRLPSERKRRSANRVADTLRALAHDPDAALPVTALSVPKAEQSIQGQTWTFRFDHAHGTLDHYWGTGVVGNGMHRWYRARLLWDSGAVIAEIPTVKKYIQLAGTLMWFRPDEPPLIARCGLPGKSVFQRGAWLLAYPRHIQWRASPSNARITHALEHLIDVSPGRGLTITTAEFEAGLSPFETSHGPAAGLFEMIQPSRLDWHLWQRWAGPRRPPEVEGPMIV